MIISQLGDIVCTILIMSLSGSALILFLFAMKPLIQHRFSKSVQYYLWIIALAALLVPISKLITIPEAPSNIIISSLQTVVAHNNAIVEQEANALPQTNTNTNPQTDIADMPVAKSALSSELTVTTVLIMAYMLIVLIVLSYNIISYVLFTRKVRRHRTRARMDELYKHVGLCGDNIAPRLYRNALATTPMLIGVFKPEIILPDCEYTEKQIQSVLMHELIHLRRRDVIVKWLSVFACALHWFNPLVWLARREIDRACELSCDEAVIRNLDQQDKRSYGETLISVASESKAPRAVLSTTMSEDKDVLKERLDAIMKYQKRTWVSLIISTVIIIGTICSVCFLGAGTAKLSAKGDNNVAEASMQSFSPSPAVTQELSSMQGILPSPSLAATPGPSAMQSILPSPTAISPQIGQVIVFEDPIVEKVIRSILDKQEDPVTDQDMLVITSFEYDPVNDESAVRGAIKTLDDLRYCMNLVTLRVLYQPITDIECLRELDKIMEVCIMGCSVSDLSPLANKNALRNIWISDNPITDASPVLVLPNLTEFNAYFGTNITDISTLPSTSSLQSFHCTNKLKDFAPLLRLENLKAVTLKGISDDFFRELVQEFRNMSAIRITDSDIDEESLNLLEDYDLYGLSLENCGLSDISGLAGLIGVADLRLGGNQIEDISVLGNFSQISYCLDLRNNKIKDLSPLESISLGYLCVSGNPYTDASETVLDKLETDGCVVYR